MHMTVLVPAHNEEKVIRIFQSPLEPIIDFVKTESDHFKDLLFELTYLNSEKGIGGFVRMKKGEILDYSRHEANLRSTHKQIQAYNEFADNYFLRYRPQEYLLKIRQQPTRELYDEVKAILNLAWKNDDLMTQEVLFQLQDAVGSLALSIAEDENRVEDLVKSFPWAFRSAIQQWEGGEKRRIMAICLTTSRSIRAKSLETNMTIQNCWRCRNER